MASYFALIVEDDPELSDIFNLTLRGIGLETEIVRDGQQALDRLGDIVPDIVLLDINLPHVSGLEIMEHIKADLRLADSLVVVITANPQAAIILDGQADLVLIKPVSFQQIRGLFGRMVQRLAARG